MRIAPSLILFACLILVTVSAPALAGTPESQETELYFISPGDGDTVSSPVQVVFGLSGMGVAPAGVEKAGTGHHHLIIDAELPPLDKPIPSDANHRHFGGGQTETVIDLPPGKHTLQLVLGDFSHVPHAEPVVSRKITITVK
ncbi:MAG: DUF4399 domain-containing protein [Pseudomonadota bacterium]|nr:DUF4399 domain-containing protein [Pseudomonadota bacterium]